MSKPAEIVNKVNAYVLGLDVHKQVIAWCLLDRRGRRAGQGEVESTPEALADLVRREIGRKKAHVAFEASTCSIWVFDLLVELFRGGDRVHVAHAKKIRAIANSTRKNDAHDAWWLAYLTYEGRLPEVHLPTGLHRQLRTISRHRVFCVQRRTQLAQVIHAHFRQAGLALPTHALARARSLGPLREHTRELPDYLQPIVAELVEELATATAQIDRWEEAMAEVASRLEEVAEIKRWIPGAGNVLAATIVGEIGDISRFKHPKALSAYAGLVPSERSSGGNTRHGAITKEGSAVLRWALVQAAVGTLRLKRGKGRCVGNWIRAQQRRLGSKKKGHVAGARKLAEAIWRLFALGEVFDIERPFGSAPQASN